MLYTSFEPLQLVHSCWCTRCLTHRGDWWDLRSANVRLLTVVHKNSWVEKWDSFSTTRSHPSEYLTKIDGEGERTSCQHADSCITSHGLRNGIRFTTTRSHPPESVMQVKGKNVQMNKAHQTTIQVIEVRGPHQVGERLDEAGK